MADKGNGVPTVFHDEDKRLESLGYKPQLNRVLGFFANFAVAFTYLSPMVGIYSLFVLGVGTGGPAYVWLTWLPVAGMLLVALIFGELASHYPVAGALYQYSKFSVGPAYGWFVGWFYGIALLVTVASVDTGIVGYVTSLLQSIFGWKLNPSSHLVILVVTVVLLAIQTMFNITGAKVMGNIAKIGVWVELVGTLGVAIILAINGFHHGFSFLFTSQGVQHVKTNPLGLNFNGHWLTGAALIAVLAPVYIFYGFESAGDISEETKDAGRQVPRAMRHALLWGGVASFILTVALLMAMPAHNPVGATVSGGGVPYILAELPKSVQDLLLVLIIFAFFSCGTSVQGAGARLAFSYARDGAVPGAGWIAKVSPRHKTPVNALIGGTAVTIVFILFEFIQPTKNIHLGFITYPANTNVLVSLISFGVSGIYLSFLMTVIAAAIARARGWIPEGRFRLGKWAWIVNIVAIAYLGLMFINVVLPTGLTSPRGYFNLDWITLLVMVVIFVLGAIYFFTTRPDRGVSRHLHDTLEPTGAELE